MKFSLAYFSPRFCATGIFMVALFVNGYVPLINVVVRNTSSVPRVLTMVIAVTVIVAVFIF